MRASPCFVTPRWSGIQTKDDASSHLQTKRGRDLDHLLMFIGLDTRKSDDYGLITRCPFHYSESLSENERLSCFAGKDAKQVFQITGSESE